MGRMRDIEREFERQRQEAAEKFMDELLSSSTYTGVNDMNVEIDWGDTDSVDEVDEEYLEQQRQLAELKEKKRRLDEYQDRLDAILRNPGAPDMAKKIHALEKEYNDVLGYDIPEDDEDETREFDIREENDNQPIENLYESTHSDVRDEEEKLNFEEHKIINEKTVNSGNRLSEKKDSLISRLSDVAENIVSGVSEGETKKKIKKGLKGWLNKLSDKIDDL